MSAGPVKITHRAPLNVIDGIPQCPHCQEPLVEVAPQRWQCGLSVALFGDMAKVLGPAIDAYLSDRSQDSAPADGDDTRRASGSSARYRGDQP
jgi:hypothetical protein